MIKKILLVLAAGALFALLYRYAGDYLSLQGIKDAQGRFAGLYEESPVLVPLAFFAVYVGMAALSVPGAALMTLAAGALFGLLVGLVIVSFASTIGATFAFLAVRYLVGRSIQAKYGSKLERINEGVRREGAFYLFAMRLVPAFPFFLINILFALTPIPALRFYWVSQLGMLAGTAVYVNAGTQLAQIESLQGLLSPTLIGSFVALGIFPLVAKKALALMRGRVGGREDRNPKQEQQKDGQA